MVVKTILGFDLDGTLTPRNKFEIYPSGLVEIMNSLSNNGHVCIPVTGKPIDYVKNIFEINGLIDSGIIGENAGTFRKSGSNNVEIFGPGKKTMNLLRQKIIPSGKSNVTQICLENQIYEIVVDPGDVSILSIFTDPKPVSHRWTFTQTIHVDDLVKKLRDLIIEEKLDTDLRVLDPFPDGGVQVIRRDSLKNRDIDKSCWTEVIREMYPEVVNINFAMFGDGHNDIPAMRADAVMALTFANANDDVKNFAKLNNGFVSNSESPEGLGVAEGLKWLADRKFFGEDSRKIGDLITQTFTEVK